VNPPYVADERSMLAAWLDFQRATLLAKCAGLDDAQLRLRAVEPSALSLIGIVRHMADVERTWFRRVLLGEDCPRLHARGEDVGGVEQADPQADLAAYREQVERSRSALEAAGSLDVLAVERRDGVHELSLRWICVHMVQEYARHNGHADLLRERLDGATGT
jgi:uncharacterized damage-inducible protein DinB